MNNLFNIVKPYFEEQKPKKQHTKATFDDIFKIVIILDESQSMQPVRKDMIKSINSFITEQKSIEGRITTFTFVKFNHKVNNVIINKPIQQVELLKLSDYVPNGSTALYDALGSTIEYFSNEKNVLMVVVTDGQENQSTHYSRNEISRMVADSKKDNAFSYVYLSCDLDTLLQGKNIGLDNSNFSSNKKMQQSKFGAYMANDLNVAVKNYRQDGISVQAQLNNTSDTPHRVVGRFVIENNRQPSYSSVRGFGEAMPPGC